MLVSNIQIVDRGDTCQLQARVQSDRDEEDAFWFAPFDLWFRFPDWCRPYLSAENGDPFLAALLVPAMRIGERLAISAPISPRLLDALPDIQHIYVAFSERNHRIPVEATARVAMRPEQEGEPGIGLFFSLGVDSFYSLLKNVRDHPADDKTITHLIYVHGVDVAYDAWDERFPPEILTNLQRVAAEFGKTLLPVVSNVRRVTEPLAPWTMVHGAAMASVALALDGRLHRVHIAASTTYDRLYPWGSHPVLDRLWSTEDLTFIHDGCEMHTIDKTGVIALSPIVLETLRPCAGYGPGYNCGGCIKCMRTMLDLLQVGALERCEALPHEIDIERLRVVLRPGGPAHVAEFTRRLEALRASGQAPAVCAVLEEHLAQGMARHWQERTGAASTRTSPRRRLFDWGPWRRVG